MHYDITIQDCSRLYLAGACDGISKVALGSVADLRISIYADKTHALYVEMLCLFGSYMN